MDTGELNLRRAFRQLIAEFFNEEDLHKAAFDIGVDYDELGGDTKTGKILSLIAYLEDRGKLYRLVGFCQQERPEIDWTGFG